MALNNMSAAIFLVQKLEHHKMTQEMLAKATGVNQQVISRIVTGETKMPTHRTAVAFSKYFKCSTDKIYGDSL